ncbi:hypothetical protein [Prosthecomicrobium sp. N25]|uniref:hypothetical protein n=1 Tax=Prosthecomicrobium sp. N25 TaxID=3129254 RepID=UPI0030787CD1
MLKSLLQGIALGAVVTMVIGFGWGGWVLGGTAKALADTGARRAVIAAMAPVCAEQFKRGADATAKLDELKKTSSWQQASFVEKGGWALMPGRSSVDDGVPQACAELLSRVD